MCTSVPIYSASITYSRQSLVVCTYDVMFFSIKKGRCPHSGTVWMNLMATMLSETVVLAHKASLCPLSNLPLPPSHSSQLLARAIFYL